MPLYLSLGLFVLAMLAVAIIISRPEELSQYPKWSKGGLAWETFYDGTLYRLVKMDNTYALFDVSHRNVIEQDIKDAKYVKENLPQFLMESLL